MLGEKPRFFVVVYDDRQRPIASIPMPSQLTGLEIDTKETIVNLSHIAQYDPQTGSYFATVDVRRRQGGLEFADSTDPDVVQVFRRFPQSWLETHANKPAVTYSYMSAQGPRQAAIVQQEYLREQSPTMRRFDQAPPIYLVNEPDEIERYYPIGRKGLYLIGIPLVPTLEKTFAGFPTKEETDPISGKQMKLCFVQVKTTPEGLECYRQDHREGENHTIALIPYEWFAPQRLEDDIRVFTETFDGRLVPARLTSVLPDDPKSIVYGMVL